MPQHHARPSPDRALLLSLLFFCSGATSLGYEVIWFKRFAYLWGNSALAMAVVVAAVLWSLGVGAFLMGRRSERVPDPIRWYGGCEVAIGVCALLIPWELQALAGLNGWLSSLLHSSTLLLSAARALLTVLVLGPACLAMGATLPLLVKHAAAVEGEESRSSSSWFYGVNTAGAAAGTLLTGFCLLPMLGLFWTNLVIAGANFAIAAAAFLAARRPAGQATPGRASATGKNIRQPTGPDPTPARARLVLAAALLAGFASLGLQMIWTRQLAVMLGGTTYAFSACLFLFLVGIGAGSLLYPALRQRTRTDLHLAAWVIGALVAATVAGRLAIPFSTQLVALLKPLRSSDLLNMAVCAGAAASLELVPALAMGVLFPLLVAQAGTAHAGAGRAIGSVYGWNTLGSIGGAFLTTLVLVPALTLPTTLALCLALYLAVLLLLQAADGTRGPIGSTLCVLLLGLAGTLLAARPIDPRLTDFGAFLYGHAGAEDLRRTVKVLSFREGRSCNVLVTEQEDSRSLRVNGKVDASTTVDMETQLGLAYLPRALRPDAREILIIGFGSGTTAGASLLFPEARVTCAEIEPAVLAASPLFAAVNHRPESSPRFLPVLDDGRSFLQSTDRRFDLVISEPSNPWIAGVSSLFSEEAYRAARSRLAPGGLFAQWIHLYALEARDYTMIARTFTTVFPHAALLWINEKNTILVGAEEPILPPGAGLEKAQRLLQTSPAARADLEKYFQARSLPALLFSRLMLDEAGLRDLVAADGGIQRHTDVNPHLEFAAPRRLFGGPIPPDRSPALAVLGAASRSHAVSGLLAASGPHPDLLLALKHQCTVFNKAGLEVAASKLARLGRSAAPQDPFFLSQLLMLTVDPLEETAFIEAATLLAALSVEEAAKAGAGLWQRRDFTRAKLVFEALVKKNPGSATGWMNLAMNYRALGLAQESEMARRRALELDPLAGLLRSTLTALETQKPRAETKGLRDLPRSPSAGEEQANPE